MLNRVLLLVSALLLGSGALIGVGFSGASWTATSNTPVAVSAAPDWTPPSVTVSPLPTAVQGSAVTVTATATDARSSIAAGSMTLAWAPVNTTTWTTLGGCSSSGSNPMTWSCTWDTTLTTDGDYQVRATATDTAGYSATSPVVLTSVANNPGVVLTPIPAAIGGTAVSVTGGLYNGGNSTATLYLEYAPSGGATWTQLNGSCTATKATSLTCRWNTTALPDGAYDVRVRSVGNKDYTDSQSGIVIDNTAPTATLSVPSGILSGTVDLTATSGDAGSGVASVDFQYRLSGVTSWSSCGTDTGSPYACTLATSPLTNGATYEFRAVATDQVGNATATTTQSRTVDNTPATVSITSPLEGTAVDGTVTVQASASSVQGVASVRIDYRAAGGTFATLCSDTTSPYSCSWNTAPLLAGSYELRAVLSQVSGGDVTSATRTVSVDHTVGVVTVTSPATGATLKGQTSVTVSGTTTSATGVSSVSLEAIPVSPSGTTVSSACTQGSGTFTCTWDTSAIVYGTFDLRAVMTQGNGVVVTSTSAVNVTVDNVNGSVSVTSPTSSSRVRGTAVAVSASASSTAGVTSVRLETRSSPNGTFAPLCTVSAAPYSCAWDTSAITYGTYEVRAVMLQGTGAPAMTSAAVPVTVDNRTLAAASVTATNGTGTAGSPDAGDQLVFTYSGLVKLSSIQAGLTNNAPGVDVNVRLVGVSKSPDSLVFTGTTSAWDAGLGSLSFTQDYVNNNKTIDFTGSKMAATQVTDAQGNPVTRITVTLGTPSSAASTVATSGTATWSPSVSTLDLFDTACSTTAATTTGVLW